MSEAVITEELRRVARELGDGAADVPFVLERPRDAGHGDFATNLALTLAKVAKRPPRELAGRIVASLRLPAEVVSKVEIAGPGFINFWLAGDTLAGLHARILEEGARYGRSDAGRGVKVNIEFVSANPTGPLHVGHGRGAALGDAIAELLEWTGHEVTREFYINDAGVQIDRLAESLWARVQQAVGRAREVPEGGYHGEYLREAASALLAERGSAWADVPEAEGLAACRAYALTTQRREQDQLLLDLGVRFDVLTSEQALYDQG
ncbi:MAG TPA: arginine--tRNA ligase, partial [Gemmatimonadales bacterium]|nr:arginine--tRNA ligase [Gemmatimonadales bacterium]